MQWVFTLVILMAFGAAEFSPAEPVGDAGLRCALVAGSASTVVLLAAAFAWLTLSPRAIGISLSARQTLAAHLSQLHAACWLLACGVIYLGLGWTQLVRQNWRLADAVLLDDALILLPAVASILLSWWALDLALRGGGRNVKAFSRLVCIPILLPVLVLLGGQDVARVLGSQEITGHATTLTAVTTLFAIVLLLPCAVCKLWDVRRLIREPLRCQLEEVSRRIGYTPKDILCVPSHVRLVNAAATGVLPRRQYVLIGEALLNNLTIRELRGIYCHELGHLAGGHLYLRILAVVVPLLLCTSFGTLASWPALLALAFMSLILLAIYSQLLEHEADLFACENSDDAIDFRQASANLLEALEKITAIAGATPRTRSVLHPSLVARARFLDRMTANPNRRDRFRRRMRTLAVSLVVLTAAAGSLAVISAI